MQMPDGGKKEQGKGKSVFSLRAVSNSPAPVTTLAYSPDGKTLAVGGYRVVRLLDAATGEVTKTAVGCADQVQCVAWSSDGKCLAAAGGVPGQAGEVVLFDAQTWKPVRTLIGHTEVVYAVTICPTVPLKIALIYPPGSIMFIPACLIYRDSLADLDG
jgi:WD40 repeat protein